MIRLLSLPLVGLFALSWTKAPAQQLAEGQQSTLQSLPSNQGQVLTVPAGLVAFDGFTLTLTPSGQPAQTLLQFPNLRFGSFTIDVGGGRVLFGESLNNTLWLVPLAGPAPSAPLATIVLNYDAAPLTSTTVLVSAKTTGFSSADNDLLVLDLATGGVQFVARLPGASGPVAVAANGDVYYGTASLAFPPPAGGSSLVRIRRPVLDAAIASQTVLGLAATELVLPGLTSPGDFAFDDDGDLWCTEYELVQGQLVSRVLELNDVATAASASLPRLAYSANGVSAGSLQFLPGGGNGVLEPFQPSNGGMLVFESQFGVSAQLRTVRAAAAATTVSPTLLPVGPFAIATTGGPANGLGLVALTIASPIGVAALYVPGFEAPLWWNQALLAGPLVLGVGFDPSGSATLPLTNPGFAPALPIVAQVAFVTAANGLGAAPPVAFQLGQ
jgi:hypothetical protein